jgi:hypothetical protein
MPADHPDGIPVYNVNVIYNTVISVKELGLTLESKCSLKITTDSHGTKLALNISMDPPYLRPKMSSNPIIESVELSSRERSTLVTRIAAFSHAHSAREQDLCEAFPFDVKDFRLRRKLDPWRQIVIEQLPVGAIRPPPLEE